MNSIKRNLWDLIAVAGNMRNSRVSLDHLDLTLTHMSNRVHRQIGSSIYGPCRNEILHQYNSWNCEYDRRLKLKALPPS